MATSSDSRMKRVEAVKERQRQSLQSQLVQGIVNPAIEARDIAIDNRATAIAERNEIIKRRDALTDTLFGREDYITAPSLGVTAGRLANKAEMNDFIRKYDELIATLSTTIQEASNIVNNPQAALPPGSIDISDFVGNTSQTDGDTTVITTPLSPSNVEYNVPPVKQAYFQPGNNLPALYGKNQPTSITEANELWTTATGSKGMFQTWTPPSADYATTLEQGEGLNSNQQIVTGGEFKRYGFQFNYNPMMVSMSYGGVPDVDVNKLADDKFNLFSTAVFQSSIEITLTLIRLFDMQYFDVNGNVTNTNAWPIPPSSTQAKQIYEKGTMYDVEFLLKTIVGLEFPTQFRGETADIGFLTGRPVELHLGKSLRYLVQVTSFALNHTHFDERMVPLVTNLSLSARRIPDYGDELIANGSN
jgi:hypothetical protein